MQKEAAARPAFKYKCEMTKKSSHLHTYFLESKHEACNKILAQGMQIFHKIETTVDYLDNSRTTSQA